MIASPGALDRSTVWDPARKLLLDGPLLFGPVPSEIAIDSTTHLNTPTAADRGSTHDLNLAGSICDNLVLSVTVPYLRPTNRPGATPDLTRPSTGGHRGHSSRVPALSSLTQAIGHDRTGRGQ